MNGFEKIDEKKLPTIKNSSNKVVKILRMLWKFGMNFKWGNGAMLPMGHYHELNLKTDISLLADIFKEFRNICIQYNRLAFCHYFTSPGLTRD